MAGKKAESLSLNLNSWKKAIEIVPYGNSCSASVKFCHLPISSSCAVFLNCSCSGPSSLTHSFPTLCFEFPAQLPWVRAGMPVICSCSLVTPETEKQDLVWLSGFFFLFLFFFSFHQGNECQLSLVLFALLALPLPSWFLFCQVWDIVAAGSGSEGMMSTLFLHSWVSPPAPFDLVLYQRGRQENGSRKWHVTSCCHPTGVAALEMTTWRALWEEKRGNWWEQVLRVIYFPPPSPATHTEGYDG